MGFTVYYRSTEPVSAETRAALEARSGELCSGRSWLSCEPVGFYGLDEGGHLQGGCKPNFMFVPHPADVVAFDEEGMPDGTLEDALDVLCQLSHDFRVDWEISHDESHGPIGLVRHGKPDQEVLAQIDSFASIAKELEGWGNGPSRHLSEHDKEDESNIWRL